MARYYFDFRSDETSSIDEDGEDLTDLSAAHRVAIVALVEAMPEIAVEGAHDQELVIEVRDELGPVLRVSAVLQSQILRKQ
jgi:Domain of unknown function (DUF6894)